MPSLYARNIRAGDTFRADGKNWYKAKANAQKCDPKSEVCKDFGGDGYHIKAIMLNNNTSLTVHFGPNETVTRK